MTQVVNLDRRADCMLFYFLCPFKSGGTFSLAIWERGTILLVILEMKPHFIGGTI